MKNILFCIISFFIFVSPAMANNSILDRLLDCQENQFSLAQENNELKNQVNYLQGEVDYLKEELETTEITIPKKSWNCQGGCNGLGNIGLGYGSTKAAALKDAYDNFGFTCSSPKTPICESETIN